MRVLSSVMRRFCPSLRPGALDVLSVASLVCLVATCATVVGPGRRVFGLTERGNLAAVLVFYGVVAASLLVG